MELDEAGNVKEGGIATKTIVSMEYIGTTDEKAKFDGKKVGDEVVFNPAAASKGNDAEVASMLNIDKEQAAEVCGFIRKVVEQNYSTAVAEGLTIQYGGSMNAGNAADLLSMKDIDGGLIGGASLKPVDFAAIVTAASK